MSDFSSELGSGLKNRLVPDGTAFDRKIDFQREKFLKGISTTKSGKKEDPTYISFRFIFDFAGTGNIEAETFLPISPLFRSMDQISRNDTIDDPTMTAQILEQIRRENRDPNNENYHSQINNALNVDLNGGYKTDTDFFYGSKLKVDDLATKNIIPFNGGLAYLGAQAYVSKRSEKRRQMLEAFKRGLEYVNKNSPWYFQTLTGLGTLVSSSIPRYGKPGNKASRTGELTINCLESIDLRISALAELYRKAMYDYTYHRVMVPENLRKFRMWLVVTEIRNIQMDYNMSDVLNPFSVPAVAKAANVISDFNSQTGFLNKTEGLMNKSTKPQDGSTNAEGKVDMLPYSLQPYVYIYQFDQCEFDFDSTYPSFETVTNMGGTMVSTSFKIHVGRVKDYKIQFNELSDVIKKDNGIKGMVINDTWGGMEQPYNDFDYQGTEGFDVTFDDKKTPGDYFAQLASNFVTNTVSEIKNEAVAFLQSKILGNIYGFQFSKLGSDFNNAFTLASAIKTGIPNPFAKYDPQSRGLGGPGERQYPTVDEDVYLTAPENPTNNLGSVFGPATPGGTVNSSDMYPDTPGKDLGLPDRIYPTNNSDEYNNTPGTDLGVPDRVYPSVDIDVYSGVPGEDLGLPDRAYPTNNDDEYNNVPGTDLGVPGRVYDTITDDVYSGVPGEDLGLPDREYPPSTGDEYNNVPGTDLGVPDRIYPTPTEDLYPTNPGIDGGLPDRQYPGIIQDEYQNVPGTDLGVPNRVYNEPVSDLYPTNPGTDLGVPDRVYPSINRDEYPGVPGTDLGVPGRTYRDATGDLYPTVPGEDLGLPQRRYDTIDGGSVYDNIQNIDNSPLGRVYPIDPTP